MPPIHVNSCEFHKVVKKLREFFETKGFVEVHTQSRLSILAACEDPSTISTFSYAGQVWPLPQTGQMWLEYELLTQPDVPGFFCLSTSYRNEPNPVPGRHDLIFPMFEFEMKGSLEDLIAMEREMFDFLGFGKEDEFAEVDYEEVAKKYNVRELEHEHEAKMEDDYGKVAFLKNFPNFTSPFWNMKQGEKKCSHDLGNARKVDAIVHGVETVGAAERSTDPEEMRKQFYNISDGGYAKILFSNFTKDRVEKELEEFLSFDFFDRCGGGIGVTRLMRAMKKSNLI